MTVSPGIRGCGGINRERYKKTCTRNGTLFKGGEWMWCLRTNEGKDVVCEVLAVDRWIGRRKKLVTTRGLTDKKVKMVEERKWTNGTHKLKA